MKKASVIVISAFLFLASNAQAGDKFAVKPHVGWTKAQVLKTYGKPDEKSSTAKGETWHYWFNKAGMFNPFAGLAGKAAKDGTIYFRNGKVRDFTWGGPSSDESELHN
jgi:outer membrane protein assembly factor BamE (lipoprotein component of BamABCDE complex)